MSPPTVADQPTTPMRTRRGLPAGLLATGATAAAGVVLSVLLPDASAGLPESGRRTLVVFACAVLAWTFSRLDDVFVGLAAALALVAVGSLSPSELFDTLGSETVWLLIAAFVLAAGVTTSGLPARVAIGLCTRARTVRGLAHLVTLALATTSLAVPATSGRAALALPVFVALARALSGRPAVVRALALLFPTVVLLSAIATLTGASAHLITDQVLEKVTGSGIGYGHWLLLGTPLALVSSHLAAELVLLLTTRRHDRTVPVRLDRGRLACAAGRRASGPFDAAERKALAVLAVVVALWCTQGLHGAPPALVALGGAILITAPRMGTTTLDAALGTVPWSLLLFMATTTVLGATLSTSGAAGWLAGTVLGGSGHGAVLLVAVVAVSVAAHLVVQSRSARSSVLVPLVIPLAVAAGLNPAAVAFASTAAAGFCHTLPSSAKPVAMFLAVRQVPTCTRGDLLRLSCLLGPLLAVLVLVCALFGWPLLGLPLR